MAVHLGFYNTSSTRTHVRFILTTHAQTGANVAPSTALEAADLIIYKATDGAAISATQRTSASGITMTSPFDSLTGVHAVDIDLTDNADAGFWAAGSFYTVVLSPDETIDSLAVSQVVAYFEIGVAKADVTQLLGTAWLTPGTPGTPDVNTKLAGGTTWGSGAITAASIASDAITDAKVASDVTIASVTGAVGSVTGAVGSVTGNVGGNVTGSVGSIATGGISAASFAAGAIDAAAIAADAIGASELAASAVSEIQSGLSTLDAAGVRTAVGLASANLDTQLGTLATAANLATVAGYLDTEIAAILADTTQIKADLPSRITKNTALSAFMFLMVDETDLKTPETGLTVTATRSLDGAAFASCANAVSEVASGFYKIDLAAGDTNGNVVTLRFTATGAATRTITIVTQP